VTTVDVSSAEHFDLLGPLPTGRLSIEASAGTGKTFALAALATRFLAERDIATSDLLIVTFTPRRHLRAARPRAGPAGAGRAPLGARR
jgi:superfamily I DNA/RNA helicase